MVVETNDLFHWKNGQREKQRILLISQVRGKTNKKKVQSKSLGRCGSCEVPVVASSYNTSPLNLSARYKPVLLQRKTM